MVLKNDSSAEERRFCGRKLRHTKDSPVEERLFGRREVLLRRKILNCRKIHPVCVCMCVCAVMVVVCGRRAMPGKGSSAEGQFFC